MTNTPPPASEPEAVCPGDCGATCQLPLGHEGAHLSGWGSPPMTLDEMAAAVRKHHESIVARVERYIDAYKKGLGCSSMIEPGDWRVAYLHKHAAAERAREGMPEIVEKASRMTQDCAACSGRGWFITAMDDRSPCDDCEALGDAEPYARALIATHAQLVEARGECERVKAERDVYIRYSSAGRELRTRLARLLRRVKRERDIASKRLARWADCFICVECGRGKADEDGCCTTCGMDVLIVEGGKLTRPLSHFYDRDAIDEYMDKLEADATALTAERDKLREGLREACDIAAEGWGHYSGYESIRTRIAELGAMASERKP